MLKDSLFFIGLIGGVIELIIGIIFVYVKHSDDDINEEP